MEPEEAGSADANQVVNGSPGSAGADDNDLPPEMQNSSGSPSPAKQTREDS